MHKLKRLLFVISAILYSQSAIAALQVDVAGGNFNPIPIYIGAFAGKPELTPQINNVIAGDLVTSGLFKSLTEKQPMEISFRPNLSKFSSVGADYVIGGKVNYSQDQQINIDFYVWNVNTGQQVLARRISGKARGWRQLSHIVADTIYNSLTGEKPYFTSKILFIDETGPVNKRIKRVAIMDQDGANVVYLTNGAQLAVTPKISPDRQSIVYTSYVDDSPHTCLQELKTGARAIVEQSVNGTIAPNFHPDGQKLLMAKLRDNGTASLFLLNIANIKPLLKTADTPRTIALHGEAHMQQLTHGNVIDAASAFSPDGKQIVFASDSSGQQKLYIIKTDGKEKKQIIFNTGSYSTPVWSPRGDYIAFTRKEHGRFSIGICRPDGSEERLLSTGFHSERPCWAPNGRSLIFFKEDETGHPKLYAIDILSGVERMVPTPHDASDPDWSFYSVDGKA